MRRDASLEVLAPPALSNCRVHLRSVSATRPGFASPGTFRPQGFSPSRRLSPRPDAQPFSGWKRLWGSALQGFIPAARSRRLIAEGLPSWRSSRLPGCSPDRGRQVGYHGYRHLAFGRLQGLAPAADSYCRRTVRSQTAADPLLSFRPLQGLARSSRRRFARTPSARALPPSALHSTRQAAPIGRRRSALQRLHHRAAVRRSLERCIPS